MKSKISAKRNSRFKRRMSITPQEHAKILDVVLNSDKPMSEILKEIIEDRSKSPQKN